MRSTKRYGGIGSANGKKELGVSVGKHDEMMSNVFEYVRGSDNLVCILMEEDAANVLGVKKPDLLVVRQGGGERSEMYNYGVIEIENGVDKDSKAKMDIIIKKMLRYGLVVDRFSVGIDEKCRDDFLEKWNEPIKVTVGGRLDDIYQEHLGRSCIECLKSLELVQLFKANDRKPRLQENTFYWDKKRKRIELMLKPSFMQEVLGFSLYLSSEDCVSVYKPS